MIKIVKSVMKKNAALSPEPNIITSIKIKNKIPIKSFFLLISKEKISNPKHSVYSLDK